MLTYQSDLTQRFVENFSQNIICHFPDGYYNGATDLGSSYINMSSFSQESDQPSNDYFMSLVITEALTFNDSITDGQSKHKRLLVFVDFTIYWPLDKSKKRLNNEIEPALDALFVNYQYRGDDGFEAYSQQDVPKDVVRVTRAEGSNKWNSKTIRYPFIVRYV